MLRKMSSQPKVLMGCVALIAIGLSAFAFGVISGHGGADAAPSGGNRIDMDTTSPSDSAGNLNVIASAGMVGTDAAWASTTKRLALTEDAGKQWRTITPPGVEAESIQAVFFSDVSHGWLVSSPDPSALNPRLSVWSTDNGGTTWTSSEISDPRLLSVAGVAISFVGQHGWVLVNEQSPGGSNAVSRLYTSADSGKSWSTHPRPPVPGELKFTSDTEAWLAGGVGKQSLWRSLDGGESWAAVSLELPAGVEEGMVSYGTPEISESGTSILPATFSRPNYETEVGVYTSVDGGNSWRLGSRIPMTGATEPGIAVESIYPDPDTLAIVDPESSELSVVAAEPSDESEARSPVSSVAQIDTEGLPGSALMQFFDDQYGLALVNDASCPSCSEAGELFFTDDGGHSWSLSPSRP